MPRGGGGGGGGGAGGDGARKDSRKTIATVQAEPIGQGQAEWYSMRASVSFIKHDLGVWYTACPTPECNRKVSPAGDMWFCEKCNQNFPTVNYRYMLNLQCQDHTGQQWVTAFDKAAETILACASACLAANRRCLIAVGRRPAAELVQMKETNLAAYEAVFDAILFRNFVLRCKVESASTPQFLCSVADGGGSADLPGPAQAAAHGVQRVGDGLRHRVAAAARRDPQVRCGVNKWKYKAVFDLV
jgi:hypothetical protein